MPSSERNFLVKLADKIPGVKGYRDREARRETDRRLREYLARRLDEGRAGLDAVRRAAVSSKDLGPLDAVGRLDRSLQKTAASLRYADAGYSGFFDQVKIGEAELDRLYAYDEALLAEVHGIAEALRAAGAGRPDAAAIEALERRAGELDEQVSRREDLFNSPTV